MTINAALAIISGIFLYQPAITFGIIPSSIEGMTQKPNKSLGYSLTGGMMIFVFGLSSWILHHMILVPLKLLPMELPLLLLSMWGWHYALSRIFKNAALIKSHLPYHFMNIAVLGSGLILIYHTPEGILMALSRIFGISVGYIAANLLMSFFREKTERDSFNGTLRGWPAYLMLCSIFWLSYYGISLLF